MRRKLTRLLVASFGIMILGLAAVIAAIIYKIGERNDGADFRPAAAANTAAGTIAATTSETGRLSAETTIAGVLDLPAGARILASSLDGDHALITVALPDGAMQLLVVDLPTGKVFVRYDLRTR